MGFLTPLLWETEPALNLRIGTSASGEGEDLPIHVRSGRLESLFPMLASPKPCGSQQGGKGNVKNEVLFLGKIFKKLLKDNRRQK